MPEPRRNQACPCGSGKKYKRCCAIRREKNRRWLWIAGVIVVLLGLAGGAVVSLRDASTEPQGKVWSEEHGHWHDAPDGTDGP
jgi:hypothetical protein